VGARCAARMSINARLLYQFRRRFASPSCELSPLIGGDNVWLSPCRSPALCGRPAARTYARREDNRRLPSTGTGSPSMWRASLRSRSASRGDLRCSASLAFTSNIAACSGCRRRCRHYEPPLAGHDRSSQPLPKLVRTAKEHRGDIATERTPNSFVRWGGDRDLATDCTERSDLVTHLPMF
jgi:hypothetical protein